MKNNFFLNNIGLKIISLLLGILIWIYFMGEKGLYPFKHLNPKYTEIIKDVPIYFLQSPFKSFEIKIKPNKVNISLTGPYKLVQEAKNSKPEVYVDIRKLMPGKHFIALRTDIYLAYKNRLKIDMPDNVEVTIAEPVSPLIPVPILEKIDKSSRNINKK
jgi:YbbR domain-containing protein